MRLLREAIVADPRNVDLYLDFATVSMDHQSFQAGIAMINSGLALQPNVAALYVARGSLTFNWHSMTRPRLIFWKKPMRSIPSEQSVQPPWDWKQSRRTTPIKR